MLGKDDMDNLSSPVAPADTVGLFGPCDWRHFEIRYRLTPREVEVAKLICSGLEIRSIAEQLDMKTSTAKTHARSICGKLQAENRISVLLRLLADAAARKPNSGNARGADERIAKSARITHSGVSMPRE